MPNKQNNAKNNAPKPKAQGQKKKTSRAARKRDRKLSRGSIVPWLRTIERPFAYGAVGIPDDQVTFSGKVVSEFTIALAVAAGSGTATTHSQGILFFPHPSCVYQTLGETTAGSAIMTDLNTAGTGYIGSGPGAVPNLASMAGGSTSNVKCRLVSLGARVIYEGTELNRSAKIMAGYLPITNVADGCTTTGDTLSALSVVTTLDSLAPVSVSMAKIRNSLISCSEARVTDGDFTCRWRPSGVPTYQIANPDLTQLETRSTTAGAAVKPSLYATESGGRGAQIGQYALAILIEGDTTPTAGSLPNIYSVSVVSNWEVVPDNRSQVAYPLTQSSCNPDQLAACLNGMSLLPTAHYEKVGSSVPFR